jgi:hypothetical protein
MNILKRFCLLSLLCLCAAAPGHAQDLSKFFKNTDGAFVLYDLKNNHYLRHNPARCKQRLTPHSTFKIPNSLIGLETGVIADADFVIPWDRQKYPPEKALSNGLGKTMIAKNIIAAAVNAGYSAMFRTASDILADLQCDSSQARRRKFSYYARPRILCIDEVGYLSYDSNAADLLYEIANRRYERSSILITTNRGFKDWNQIFPNATCIATLLDRLTHHAEIAVIEGKSYRVRESELESTARRKASSPDSKSASLS